MLKKYEDVFTYIKMKDQLNLESITTEFKALKNPPPLEVYGHLKDIAYDFD